RGISFRRKMGGFERRRTLPALAQRRQGIVLPHDVHSGNGCRHKHRKDLPSRSTEAPVSSVLLNPFDVTADGKRFLVAQPEGSNAQTPFTIVLNWQASL